jgi:hypothetical protein
MSTRQRNESAEPGQSRTLPSIRGLDALGHLSGSRVNRPSELLLMGGHSGAIRGAEMEGSHLQFVEARIL